MKCKLHHQADGGDLEDKLEEFDERIATCKERLDNPEDELEAGADDKPTIMTDGGTEVISQTDECGPHGDRDPCEEFLLVDGEKVPLTGVRVACYDYIGHPPEDVIDFDRVERDGDNLFAVKEYDDEMAELCRGYNDAWEIHYHTHPVDADFDIVWERSDIVAEFEATPRDLAEALWRYVEQHERGYDGDVYVGRDGSLHVEQTKKSHTHILDIVEPGDIDDLWIGHPNPVDIPDDEYKEIREIVIEDITDALDEGRDE